MFEITVHCCTDYATLLATSFKSKQSREWSLAHQVSYNWLQIEVITARRLCCAFSCGWVQISAASTCKTKPKQGTATACSPFNPETGKLRWWRTEHNHEGSFLYTRYYIQLELHTARLVLRFSKHVVRVFLLEKLNDIKSSTYSHI